MFLQHQAIGGPQPVIEENPNTNHEFWFWMLYGEPSDEVTAWRIFKIPLEDFSVLFKQYDLQKNYCSRRSNLHLQISTTTTEKS